MHSFYDRDIDLKLKERDEHMRWKEIVRILDLDMTREIRIYGIYLKYSILGNK